MSRDIAALHQPRFAPPQRQPRSRWLASASDDQYRPLRHRSRIGRFGCRAWRASIASVDPEQAALKTALSALRQPGVAPAAANVPACPGLYALRADATVWTALGLGSPPDERPLYVGKAEQSLQSRDVRTHFRSGRTGSSTVRRSLAALLKAPLQLSACPRTRAKPDGSASFGLEPESDDRLRTGCPRTFAWLCGPGKGSASLAGSRPPCWPLSSRR